MKAVIKLDEKDIREALAEWVEKKFRQKAKLVTVTVDGPFPGQSQDPREQGGPTVGADVEVEEMPPKVRSRKQ